MIRRGLLTMPLIAALVAVIVSALPSWSVAAWQPDGIDLSRPRLLLRGADLEMLQGRLDREPYRSVLQSMLGRTRLADSASADDHSLGAERNKARAAKNLAFLYALSRNSAGQVATELERQAVGDRVRDLLLHLYNRSRLAVPPPLGAFDRDINTSEELMQWATAYDTILGAGYDLGEDADAIRERLADLAAELYDNYAHPNTAGGFAQIHWNNHRAKSGASLVVAAIALAEYEAAPGSDLRGVRDPAAWLGYGLDQVDLIHRWLLVAGDGAYGEGPFYLRYTAQNLLPFARAWDRLVDGRDWNAGAVIVPSPWRHPLFARTQRWVLDMTLPSGSLAPVDDGNPGRAYYFGAAPLEEPLAAAYAWRWANAPDDYEADGSVDLGADSIVNYDEAITAAPPSGSPTAFYLEGGQAIFRSDWSRDAVVAIVQAERDTAAEFGRDRDGRGVGPQSHEHAEPGAFLLQAFGERLALDPGYFSFGQHEQVNQPEDHNLVLVGGRGPLDYLVASYGWIGSSGAPRAEGMATLSDAIDSDFLDAALVRSRYGEPSAVIERRFLFADDRYLVLFDTATADALPPSRYTWLLHGNGGGTSGGDFESTAAGGRWTLGGARLDNVLGFDVAGASFSVGTGIHEEPERVSRTHSVLQAEIASPPPIVRSAQIVYPSRSSVAAPSSTPLEIDGGAGVALIDVDGDRRVVALHRASSEAPLLLPASLTGLRDTLLSGRLAIFDAQTDGALRLAWVEGSATLAYGETTYLRAEHATNLGLRLAADRAEVVVAGGGSVEVDGLPFTPRAADGACSLDGSNGIRVVAAGDGRIVLRSDEGNSAPAADPGAPLHALPGDVAHLDSSASCDLDGDAVTSHWELTSAPAGSAWSLRDAETATPMLAIDRIGPYRLKLTVTDVHGVASRPTEALVLACPGDCDEDGITSAAERRGLLEAALRGDATSACEAGDANRDGVVAVDDLIVSVRAGVGECRGL